MPAEKQLNFIVGRRSGIFVRLEDLDDPGLVRHTEKVRTAYGVNLDNIEDFTADAYPQSTRVLTR